MSETRECGHRAPCACPLEGQPERPVGIQAVPTLVTPPKYGPPPGFSPEKWRTMSRANRRAELRNMARTINKVVK